MIRFLHINKTGGGSIRSALRVAINRGRDDIVLSDHWTLAADTPDVLLFTLRDPITRFVSGFNSSLRKGNDGTAERGPKAKAAFASYQSPNALAEAIGSEESARTAIKAIGHIRRHQHLWFPSPAVEWIADNPDRILWIGFQETLAADFEILKCRLDLPRGQKLLTVHKAPDTMDTHLSTKARANLSRWYSEDIRFVQWLRKNVTGGRPPKF